MYKSTNVIKKLALQVSDISSGSTNSDRTLLLVDLERDSKSSFAIQLTQKSGLCYLTPPSSSPQPFIMQLHLMNSDEADPPLYSITFSLNHETPSKKGDWSRLLNVLTLPFSYKPLSNIKKIISG